MSARSSRIPREPARSGGDDDLVEMRIVLDHRSGGRLDHVGNVRLREPVADGVDCWRREDDIADLTEADQ